MKIIQPRTPSMQLPFHLSSNPIAPPRSLQFESSQNGMRDGKALVPQLINIAAEMWYLKMTKRCYTNIAAHPPRRASTRWSVAPPSRLYSEAVLSSALLMKSCQLGFVRVGGNN